MARIVFLGTPDFAVPSLRSLLASRDVEVVGVVTQPDRPAGRGKQIAAPPVKKEAEKHGLPVFQPETLRDPQAVKHIQEWQPELMVVVAFGQILSQRVLDLPGMGCINVHASLLPRWRGAAPIQYAIRAGDKQTGVTIMKMDAGLDTGPILSQRSVAISPEETGASLHDKLATLGAEMLPEVLTTYLRGEISALPQPQEGATVARSLKKEEGLIDWEKTAEEIDRLVRAFTPWPGTYTYLDGRLLKIHRGHAASSPPSTSVPGTLVAEVGRLAVQTGGGLYWLEEIQPAGRPRMDAGAFLSGHPQVNGKALQNS